MNEDKTPKISVIVPIYNAEIFLERTLESIKAQTYDNVQIILVNDYSTDNSNFIILRFIADNPTLKIDYIDLPKNLGSAGARQVAIQYVEGEYLHFLDSDDYILPNTYSMAVACMKSNNADICFWGRTDVNENGDVVANYVDEFHYFDGVKTGVEVCKLKLQQWLWICTGNAFYSFRIWRKLDPLFFNGLNMGEDLYSICKMSLYAERVSCIKSENLICTSRDASLSHTWNPSQKLEALTLLTKLRGEIDGIEHLTPAQREDIKEALDWMTVENQINILDAAMKHCSNLSLGDTIKVVKGLKLHSPKVKHQNINVYLKRNRRIKYYMYKFSTTFFVIIMKIMDVFKGIKR